MIGTDAVRTRADAGPTVASLTIAASACLLGFAVERTHGLYDPTALAGVTVAILVCLTAVVARSVWLDVTVPVSVAVALLLAALAGQVATIVAHNRDVFIVNGAALAAGGLAVLYAVAPKKLRGWIAALMLVVFAVYTCRAFLLNWTNPNIDVFMFQQKGSEGFLQGHNPYAARFPSLYPYGTPLYGRDVVDRNNQLTYGFPYPPLSLLMVVPAYLFGGDPRFSHVVAMTISTGLMIAARPDRWTGLVAAMFMLTPGVFFIVERSWTEPLVVLTFSLVMFCALRWRPGLPYALGLFFATKQYTVLVLPLVWLLVDATGDRWRRLWALLVRAGAVVAATCLPFILWDPREFFRSVVEYQFVQPLRRDALSYLAWIKINVPRARIGAEVAFAAGIAANALALWRCPKTPAGFAAGTTLVFLLFFAFNKQAFYNYYYLEIATACWAAVATGYSTSPHGTKTVS